jgi:uncharacterized protein (DUF1697 family)
MPRYVAFLRGVSPMNAKMPQLRQCFEDAGFTEVKTVLGSGNVAFDARRVKESTLERRAEAAMRDTLDKGFPAIVRSVEDLRRLLDDDPFADFTLPKGAKRVVTFLREPAAGRLKLPIEQDGARILAARGREVLSAYVVGDKGPVFMTLIEKAFGKDVTTRTWETVGKCAVA